MLVLNATSHGQVFVYLLKELAGHALEDNQASICGNFLNLLDSLSQVQLHDEVARRVPSQAQLVLVLNQKLEYLE